MAQMHVVIAGGGVAAVECALALRDLAGDRVSITLVSPRPDFVLTPMAVGEPFSAGHAGHRPLESLAAEIDVGVVAGAVTRVRRDDHTVELADGSELGYDVLVLAPGARPVAAYGHVQTFSAEDDPTALSGLIADLEEGWSHSVAFIVPPGVSWPLPAYELALLTTRDIRAMGIDGVTITLITPEARPLDVFGTSASDAVAEMLEQAGVAFEGSAQADVRPGGHIDLGDGRSVQARRIVALPLLQGPRIAGVPRDESGFIPIDGHARVIGADDVYAAGDGTTFPVKQGGIATQQADAAAEDIAARAGASLTPQPFRPVLRGHLLTGTDSPYLRRDVGDRRGETAAAALWWPPTKVAGRYLGPWLVEREPRTHGAPAQRTLDIEVPLDHHLPTA
jgi:sulfide:quinone oxidoreductase